ncbi:MAG: GntR family transcriptional regulator [Romboutsia sp.]|nr:GntR family transcriptional regulator [Romboutsia sp.]
MELYEKESSESRKDYAFRVLRDNIINLNLKPGQMLESENYLSEKLGVSRTPLREIIATLKNEGLVEVKSHVGTYIQYIDWSLIIEINFVKVLLEREVLKEAISKFPSKVLLELEKNLYLQKFLLDVENSDNEFKELDEEFHKLLYKGVNKKFTWILSSKLNDNYKRFMNLAINSYDKNKIYSEHVQYIEIIKNKRINEVDCIVKKHIEDAFEVAKKEISQDYDKMQYIQNYSF